MTAQRPASPRPLPAILTVKPYIAGAPSIPGMRAKLNSNEGAFGAPPAARRAIADVAALVHRYPDGTDTALRTAIGRYHRLDPELIVCSAGSDRIINTLIAAYGGPGTETIISQHTFYEYERGTVVAGGAVVKVPERGLNQFPQDYRADVDGMIRAVTDRTRLVFLANPDNPTGSCLDLADIQRLRDGLPPDVVLVLDAAYGEFVTHPDYDAGQALVDRCIGGIENVVMTRTFSKMWGLAGERIGWCYAPSSIVDVLNRARDPFNIAMSASAAAIAALGEPGWQDKAVGHNTDYRRHLEQRLTQAGVTVYPSEANFILAGFGTGERASAANEYLKARGVLVRTMVMYDLPHALRISIGPADEVALAAEEITAFMQTF